MAVTEPTTAMEMLALAIADPRRAEAWAARMLSEDADPWTLSVARHARGIVLRDRGLLEPALVELRLAVRLARRSGDVDRESDVRATLGSVLALVGRTAAGLEQLDRAVASVADPVVAAKILVRRSYVRYQLLGQPHEALDDLALALPRLRNAGERVWEARTLNLMGLSHMALGQADRAAMPSRRRSGSTARRVSWSSRSSRCKTEGGLPSAKATCRWRSDCTTTPPSVMRPSTRCRGRW